MCVCVRARAYVCVQPVRTRTRRPPRSHALATPAPRTRSSIKHESRGTRYEPRAAILLTALQVLQVPPDRKLRRIALCPARAMRASRRCGSCGIERRHDVAGVRGDVNVGEARPEPGTALSERKPKRPIMARRQLLISTRRPFSFLAACSALGSAPRPRQNVRVLACESTTDASTRKGESPVFTTHKLADGNWIVHAMAAKCFAREASLREAYRSRPALSIMATPAARVAPASGSHQQAAKAWQSPSVSLSIELRKEAPSCAASVRDRRRGAPWVPV